MSIIFLFSPIIIGLIAVLGALFLMAQSRNVMLKSCLIMFGVASSVGFVFYTFCYLPREYEFTGALWAAFRGLFSTGRMFIVESDFDNLLNAEQAQWLVGNMWLQILFWFCHVLALIVSVSAIIYLFGRKFIDGFRLRYGRQTEVYVITSTSNEAFTLGKNISNHDNSQRPDVRRLILFFADTEVEAEEKYEETADFGGIAQSCNRDFCASLRKAGFGT